MKRVIVGALALGLLGLGALSPAQAQGGCGPYAHRGWDGWCHPGGWGHPPPFGWHRHWHPGWGWHRPGWGPHHPW